MGSDSFECGPCEAGDCARCQPYCDCTHPDGRVCLDCDMCKRAGDSAGPASGEGVCPACGDLLTSHALWRANSKALDMTAHDQECPCTAQPVRGNKGGGAQPCSCGTAKWCAAHGTPASASGGSE